MARRVRFGRKRLTTWTARRIGRRQRARDYRRARARARYAAKQAGYWYGKHPTAPESRMWDFRFDDLDSIARTAWRHLHGTRSYPKY